MMEEQLSVAVEDKSKAVAEVEQRMTTKLVKQQVCICTAVIILSIGQEDCKQHLTPLYFILFILLISDSFVDWRLLTTHNY